MSDSKVKKSELKVGDVFLYEPLKGEWESELIALLSKSNVSHAAMYYENNLVIEENEPKAGTADLTKRYERKTHILRMKDKKDGVQPAVTIAKDYVDAGCTYPMSALPCIGIYLLTNDLTVNVKYHNLIVKVVELAMGVLIEYLNKKEGYGKEPMVCSQFVYNCYRKSGNEIILAETGQNSILSMMLEQSGSKDLLLKEWGEKDDEALSLALQVHNKEEILGELCSLIKNSMEQEVLEERQTMIPVLSDDFTKKVMKFLDLAYMAAEKNMNGLKYLDDKYKEQMEKSSDVLEKIAFLKSYFVLPGDFFKTKNLDVLGVLDYSSF